MSFEVFGVVGLLPSDVHVVSTSFSIIVDVLELFISIVISVLPGEIELQGRLEKCNNTCNPHL